MSKCTLYFSLLDEKISKYDVEAHNIYNMDEKRFMLGILTRSKRVFSRLDVQVHTHRSRNLSAIEQ